MRLILVILALLPSELLVRAFDMDSRILASLMYYQGVDVPAHEPVPDARLYALKPGFSGELRGYRVSVNSLGFRGPERAALKKPGALRVLCYGSSNTYGAAVNDDQSWPARLENELSRRLKRPVEVWNGGVSAYQLRQMLAAARSGIERYQPDLVLLQTWNFGRRPLLLDEPLGPVLAREPDLLRENLRFVPFGAAGERLLAHWRAARFFVIALNYPMRSSSGAGTDFAIAQEREAAAAFGRETRVPWAVVVPPGKRDSDIPAPEDRVIRLADLVPAGAGPEYFPIHPPASVLSWYGGAIAAAIQDRKLLR